MSISLKKLMAEANAVIDTMSVHEAKSMWSDSEIVFVDVRETTEALKNGIIPGSVHAPRGFLEFIADPQGPMHNEEFSRDKKLILYCATGGRSVLAAKTLHDLGYTNVANLAGGFTAWSEASGAVETYDGDSS